MSRSLGAFGEAWAVGHLSRLGYRILARNVRYRCGELDIVARQGQDLVFVEVKCRRTEDYGSPLESITARRFGHLEAAIARYLAETGLEDVTYRLDVLGIEVAPSGHVERYQLLRAVGAPG